MNLINCPSCQSENFESVSAYRAKSPELQNKEKVRCKTCELVYLTPLPLKEDWEKYNLKYFEKAHGGLSINMRARAYHRALAKIRVQHVKKFIETKNIKVKNVFEVGPGNGEFAEYWKSLFSSHYEALETDSTLYERLRSLGVNILKTPHEHQEPADLVVISHVLEHTLDPLNFISSMTSAMKPGGVLFIEVPCLDFKYKNIDEPHILFFDKPAMVKLLHDAGFCQIELTYHGDEHKKLILQNQSPRISAMIRRGFEEISARMINRARKGSPETELTRKEWIAAASFKPHIEQIQPARWLRAMAKKG